MTGSDSRQQDSFPSQIIGQRPLPAENRREGHGHPSSTTRVPWLVPFSASLTVKLRKLNLKEKESNRSRLCFQAGCARRKTLPLAKS
jgi:hypothetical protein